MSQEYPAQIMHGHRRAYITTFVSQYLAWHPSAVYVLEAVLDQLWTTGTPGWRNGFQHVHGTLPEGRFGPVRYRSSSVLESCFGHLNLSQKLEMPVDWAVSKNPDIGPFQILPEDRTGASLLYGAACLWKSQLDLPAILHLDVGLGRQIGYEQLNPFLAWLRDVPYPDPRDVRVHLEQTIFRGFAGVRTAIFRDQQWDIRKMSWRQMIRERQDVDLLELLAPSEMQA